MSSYEHILHFRLCISYDKKAQNVIKYDKHVF